jgi:protein TonB
MSKSTTSDRLVFTILISIIIHLIVVLGISFDVFSKPTNAPVNNLEITLVKQQDQVKPEQADFLAQANNEGGGETDTPSPEPTQQLPLPIAEEEPSSEPEPPVSVTPAKPDPVPVIQPEPKPTPPVPEQVEPQPEKSVKKVTQKEAERQVEKVEQPETELEPEKETVPETPRPSARDLMLQARNEIHELQDRLDKSTIALSKRPKKRRISASTKEFAASAYMKAWEMKVERIGNTNYPQEARRKGLNGSLMLSVDINPDGSVPSGGIVISRSSGHKVLDEAAVRIVRLGAPYAAIPDNVLRDNDMLTIIRTWKFETGRGLSTR